MSMIKKMKFLLDIKEERQQIDLSEQTLILVKLNMKPNWHD